MDDKLKKLIEQNGGYITRKQIIGNRYLYYRLLESVKSGEIVRLKSGVYLSLIHICFLVRPLLKTDLCCQG